MRPAGFSLTALLLGVTVASSQQPVPPAAPGGAVPGAPVTPPQPPAPPAADPRLDAHLAKWEKTMSAVTNFRFVLELKRTEFTFKTDRTYSGVVLCMKPNLAVLRLNNDADKTGADYEAFISDGKAVYEYNGLAKTVTKWKLPEPNAANAGATDNLMIDFLSGLKADAAKKRFELTLFKEDANYVYLDVKPILPKDKADFQQLRMALYGPATKWAYLPAQVLLVKPSGDMEQWKFKEPQTNIPGLTAKDFQYQKVPGFAEQEGKPAGAAPPPAARPPMPILPAGSGLPAGPSAVRPGVPPKK
jgi:TIGR03009 family protein